MKKTPKPKVTLAAFQAARIPRAYCKIRTQAAELLEATERKEFQAALDDHSIPLTAIIQVLTARGLRVNETSLHHHRHRRCSECYGVPR